MVPYSSVKNWDSVPGEPGNQPLYVEAPDGQVRAGSPYACDGKCGDANNKKGKICVGGKNAGTDCTKKGARISHGGVYVGADTIVANTGLYDAINSIQKNFAKSMLGEGWKWSEASEEIPFFGFFRKVQKIRQG